LEWHEDQKRDEKERSTMNRGWYEIDGQESWHGSDDPRYLRAMMLTGNDRDRQRARAVLDQVERDTPRFVRWWRDFRWGGHG
jgi:hypothetical protein